MKRPIVILGMSGGVDSSVAAALLVEQGFDVRGVTLQVWEHEDETVAASKRWQERGCCKVGLARHVAKLLGFSHELIDTREAFRAAVIDDFISGYLNGTTPNPCVRCNERVKLRLLYHLARERCADYVATGHYARIRRADNGQFRLARAADLRKDQSYFLYRLQPRWLDQLMFPLGSLQKTEVWHRAEALGLPVDELKESQEICFVTQGDYRTFLQTEAPQARHPGQFTDTAGNVLGAHEGIAFYTPGQRRGLGVSASQRLYVQRVVPQTNTVVLATDEDLFGSSCLVSDLNAFDAEAIADGGPVLVKIRYASTAVPARLTDEGDGAVRVHFLTPQRAVTPGQSAVFYRDEVVLGGGIIQRAH
jgi:tRNA-specific 2-thiouridylase